MSLREALGRTPWWLGLLLGIAAVWLGAAVALRPFTSLGVLVALVAAGLVVAGISEIASSSGRIARASGVALVVAGIAVAVWPDLTIRGLAVLAGVALLIGGGTHLVEALHDAGEDRLVAVPSGLARVIFGGLALVWPDVTALVLGVLVGPALIVVGAGQIVLSLRRRSVPDAAGIAPPRLPRWLRATAAVLALVVAFGFLAVAAVLRLTSTDRPGAFYAAPDDVPSRPGVLLRSEPFDRVPDGARGRRILYTTTRDDETPALASGLVLVAKDAPAGPRPVVAWAHGTTGYATTCAPSLLPEPLRAGAMPAVDAVLARGWVIVATDYVGLGTDGPHPYLIGDAESRSVLDAVRAARSLNGIELADRVVVWGHSQGGGAALAAGAGASRYAPDVHLAGVAALAPASNLPEIAETSADSAFGKVVASYLITAYSALYPDVASGDYVRPAARSFVRQTARRCLGAELLPSLVTALAGEAIVSRDPATGPLGRRLEENVSRGHVAAPLLVAQGLADRLIRPLMQKGYVDGLCASGQSLEYRTYAGEDHVSLVLGASSRLPDDLVAWTAARFRGEPAPGGCVVTAR